MQNKKKKASRQHHLTSAKKMIYGQICFPLYLTLLSLKLDVSG
jgi:hypothetical protein